MLNKIIVFLLSILFTSFIDYKNNSQYINISFNKRLQEIDNVLKINYSVYPAIYNDKLAIKKYYIDEIENKEELITNSPIEIINDENKQFLEIKCIKPFEKKIKIKLFSILDNNRYDFLILKYKSRIEIKSTKLVLDEKNNNLKLENEYNIIQGTNDVILKEKINEVNLLKDVEEYIKYKMTINIEKKIEQEENVNEISFNHIFLNFDSRYLINLFNPSYDLILSKLCDQVTYSYYLNNEKIIKNRELYFYEVMMDHLAKIKEMELFNIKFEVDGINFQYNYYLK